MKKISEKQQRLLSIIEKDYYQPFTINTLVNRKGIWHNFGNFYDDPYHDLNISESEKKRLNYMNMKHHVEQLVKKGKLRKIKKNGQNEYIFIRDIPSIKSSVTFTQVLCDIDRLDTFHIHTFKDARQIAYEKYQMPKSEFDAQFRKKVDEDFHDFDLGQGIREGLSSSDSFDINNTPYFFFRLHDRFKQKHCQS